MSEITVIRSEDALNKNNVIFVDTRSPSEFLQGHIPGARNLPILEDEERAIVGTLYKQTGPEEARRIGLEMVSGKLPHIVSSVESFRKSGADIVVYCWRGGMRSRSVVTILDLMGIPSTQLFGGYKAYRQYIRDSLTAFDFHQQIVVLCGSTGVGKTTALLRLHGMGFPVLDLEGLANHRGSAFGQVGLGLPATAQTFDSQLWDLLQRYKDCPYLLVECESKRIGNVYLPETLHSRIKTGTRILLHASIAVRVQRLISEYTQADIIHGSEEIRSSILSLQRKLGKRKIAEMISLFDDGCLEELVRILLVDYYDPLYGYESCKSENYALVVDMEDMDAGVAELQVYLNNLERR